MYASAHLEKVEKEEFLKKKEWASFESWVQKHCCNGKEPVCVFQKQRVTVRLLGAVNDLPPGVYDVRGYPLFTLAHHGFSDKDKVMDLIDGLSKDHNQ